MDPQYTAPAPRTTQVQPQATVHAIGQTGIPFGGGAFTWTGTGWTDPTSGRQWDANGNTLPAQTAPGPGYDAVAAAANPITDWWTQHSGKDVNAYNFGRLKSSTQQLVLAGAESAGHDQGDVVEDIQRTLPTATGPKRGYIAPMGTR